MEAIEIIKKIYEYDDHKSSDKPNSISTTQLLGPLFKIRKILEDTPTDQSLIDFKFKRSSTFGSALHARAKLALDDNPDFVLEKYLEREITIGDTTYVISGSFDGLVKNSDGTWDIYDIKTAYGKERKEDALMKDSLQMSIYRWLINGRYDVNDRGWILFISQNVNAQEAYPVLLRSESYVEDFISTKIEMALMQEEIDCNKGISYSSCTYCMLVCDKRKG